MNRKGMAIGQTLLLILGIMAFGFLIGSEVKVVSAAGLPVCNASTIDGLNFECLESAQYRCRNVDGVYKWETTDLDSPTCTSSATGATCSEGSKKDFTFDGDTLTYVCKKTDAGAEWEVLDTYVEPEIEAETETEVGGEDNILDKGKEIVSEGVDVVTKLDLAKKGLKKASDRIDKVINKDKPSTTKVPTSPMEEEDFLKLSKADQEKELDRLAKLTEKTNAIADKEDLLKKGEEAFDEAYRAAKENGDSERLAIKAGEEEYKKITGKEKPPIRGLGVFLKNLKTSLTKNIWKGAAHESTASVASKGVASAIYAAAGAFAAKAIFKYAGAGERNMEMISKVTTAVAVSGAAFFTAAGAFGWTALIPGPGWAFAGAMAVVAAVSAILYKNMSHEFFSYKLTLWQPVSGGENCQACNELEYGCSEYQCKTFGAACKIINEGTKDELCDWENKNDMKSPIMNTLDVLGPGYRYNPDTGVQLPDTGFNLEYGGNSDGCLPAFEGIEFGITTDEPAQCKIDMDNVYSYDNMTAFMAEGSVYTYNHTFSVPNIALPSAYAINEAGFTIDEGNDYEFYMRCMDVNGNDSPYSLAIKFCVDDGPDTTAPTISTNYISGAYIRSEQVEIDDLEVYTNEPADCRWDHSDREYEDMTNLMTDCSTTYGDYTFPDSYSYGCRTTLTGIKNNERNTYYIRCEDKPGLSPNASETRISNRESYVLDLQGTNELVIDEIVLNQEDTVYTADDGSVDGITISDATEEIQVRVDVFTSQGAGSKGDARCTYSESGVKYQFYNNQNYDYTPINNHYWYLTDNTYNFEVECCDLANNCDWEDISFDVESDTSAPLVARSYYEDDLMKLVTDEDATCVYSLSTCNYLVEDGLSVNTMDNINHFVTWEEKESYYVKCKDIYENYPDPNECSIIVRAQYEYDDAIVAE